jgi:hypothetical protein
MADETPVTRAEKINGRGIIVTCSYGQWRWLVQTRGPNGLQIFRLAGATLAEAQQLARELGPFPALDADETANPRPSSDGK